MLPAISATPHGLSPAAEPTTFVVYIAAKQWRKIDRALTDPNDALIAPGVTSGRRAAQLSAPYFSGKPLQAFLANIARRQPSSFSPLLLGEATATLKDGELHVMTECDFQPPTSRGSHCNFRTAFLFVPRSNFQPLLLGEAIATPTGDIGATGDMTFQPPTSQGSHCNRWPRARPGWQSRSFSPLLLEGSHCNGSTMTGGRPWSHCFQPPTSREAIATHLDSAR